MEQVRDAITRGAALLQAAGIESPRLESRLLLSHALACPVEPLLRQPEQPADTASFDLLLARRARREPLALILGYREFWSLRFAVSPATLIPRPESETLVEAALGTFPDRSAPIRVLDLGTGTGCLLLAVLHEYPAAFGIGVDLAYQAAALAGGNASALGLSDRAAFLCGDWASALHGRFDVILSNPPYIQSASIPALMPEVADYEPRGALDGGPDGLEAYRHLIPAIPQLLEPAGAAIVELGAGQAGAAMKLAKSRGLTTCAVEDLAGTPRALVLRNTLP